jgi:hypothetical protein
MTESNHFLSPKLTGKRFDKHTVPVEVLQDFAALQELIVDLAKKIYLDENQARKRVPKGFTDGITLSLQEVEEGSAILNFVLGTAMAATPILGNDSNTYAYFEKAKDKVIEAIATAEDGGNVRDVLNVKHISYFNRIGRNLKEDEVISFNPNTPKVANLNKLTRHRIVQSLSEDASYTDNFDFVAPIAGIDQIDKLFSVLIDGQKIPAKLDQNNYKLISATFTDLYSQKYVSIKGEGVYDRNSRLTKINSITNLDILDPLDVSLRITELSELKNGWYNNEGQGPDAKSLWKFEQLFKENYGSNLPLPTIFPTLEGNIQLEWTIASIEISLEVNLSTFISELVSVNTETQDVQELYFDLNTSEEWNNLNKHFNSYDLN